MSRRPTSLALAAAHQPTETAAAPLATPKRPAPQPVARASSRAGKAMVAGWYDKAAVKQLRMIAVNRETTIQQQLGRAINLLFREESMPALAQIERGDDGDLSEIGQ